MAKTFLYCSTLTSMLRHLHVRNFALVEELDIEFDDGLTVITGESGAGKTILLAALALVLGQRASTDSIRPGAARAEVSAEFDLTDNTEALAHLETSGFREDADDGRCLLRRTVTVEGRSRAYINGSAATAGQLATLADFLIDIHGQSEQALLLRRDVQRQLLDGYAGCEDLARTVRRAWDDWQAAEQARDALAERIAASTDRLALLEYQVNELDELALTDGEFEALETSFKRLAKRDDNQRSAAGALNVLSGEQESGINEIHRLRAAAVRHRRQPPGAGRRQGADRRRHQPSQRSRRRAAPLPGGLDQRRRAGGGDRTAHRAHHRAGAQTPRTARGPARTSSRAA